MPDARSFHHHWRPSRRLAPIAAVIPGSQHHGDRRALGSGFGPTFFMGPGLILGDMLYPTSVIPGLAFIARAFT